MMPMIILELIKGIANKVKIMQLEGYATCCPNWSCHYIAILECQVNILCMLLLIVTQLMPPILVGIMAKCKLFFYVRTEYIPVHVPIFLLNIYTGTGI